MKKFLIFLKILAFQSAFALDEYLPIEPNTFQINGNYAHLRPTGFYDKNRDHEDFPSEFNLSSNYFLLQLKYGIMPGLSLEVMAIPFISANENSSDANGLGQPSIGLKYVSPEFGMGGIFNLTLPLGSKDIVGSDPTMALEVGGRFGQTREKYSLLGGFSYVIFFEDQDNFKRGNIVDVFIKPELPINGEVGINCIVDWQYHEKVEFSDDYILLSSDLLTISPSFKIRLNAISFMELNYTHTVRGRNSFSAWGLGAEFFVNLKN